MIKCILNNDILKYITEIDKNGYRVASVKISRSVANKLRKNSNLMEIKGYVGPVSFGGYRRIILTEDEWMIKHTY